MDSHPAPSGAPHSASNSTGYVPTARPVVFEDPPARPPDPLLLAGLSRTQGWADVGLFILLMVGFELVVGSVFGQLVGGTRGGVGDDLARHQRRLMSTLLVPTVVVRAAFSIILIWILVRWRKQSSNAVGLTRKHWVVDSLLGMAGCALAYGIIFMSFPIMSRFLPEWIDQMMENRDRLLELVPPVEPMDFLGLALAIGVYEELVFRGFLMVRLRRATGSWIVAVVLSTALFTAAHALDQVPVALGMITMLSVIFSLLTIWRRSVIPAIVAHAVFDFTQFLGIYVQTHESWS